MFTVLQKVKFIALLATLVLFFTSCKKDKDDEPATTSTFAIDGKSFTLTTGFIDDYGSSGVDTDTHYNYDFYMLDGTLNTTTGGYQNIKVALYFELFSPGTTNFKVGKFNFIDSDDINTDADVANKYYFEYADAYFDLDGDNTDDENEFFEVIGGSITVSGGTNNNYTVDIDVTLNDNKTIKAKFTYTFTVFDETDGFAPTTVKSPKHFSKRLLNVIK